MNPTAANPDFPASQKLYAWLLRAYPPAHRAEYGVVMAQLFRDQCRDAWREAGGWGLTKLWFRVLPDWASTSVRERLAALNERKTMNDKLSSLSRDRTTPSAIFIRVAVTVFLLTIVIATAVTFILPESYASTCKLKVENDQPDAPNATNSAYAYDPYFIQTTFEIIGSQLVLSNVAVALNLNVDWGKKYFAGETLKTSETITLLKNRMVLAPVGKTKLIAITVYSDDKNEAAHIANAIAETYRNWREEAFRRQNTLRLEPMLSPIQEQFARETNEISQVQSNVEHLQAILGIRGETGTAELPTASIGAEKLKNNNTDVLEQYKRKQNQLAEMRAQHDLTYAKLLELRLAIIIPIWTSVQIIDEAMPGRFPVRPNKTLNIVMGAMFGIFLGLMAGGAAALVAAKLGNRAPKNAPAA